MVTGHEGMINNVDNNSIPYMNLINGLFFIIFHAHKDFLLDTKRKCNIKPKLEIRNNVRNGGDIS